MLIRACIESVHLGERGVASMVLYPKKQQENAWETW